MADLPPIVLTKGQLDPAVLCLEEHYFLTAVAHHVEVRLAQAQPALGSAEGHDDDDRDPVRHVLTHHNPARRLAAALAEARDLHQSAPFVHAFVWEAFADAQRKADPVAKRLAWLAALAACPRLQAGLLTEATRSGDPGCLDRTQAFLRWLRPGLLAFLEEGAHMNARCEAAAFAAQALRQYESVCASHKQETAEAAQHLEAQTAPEIPAVTEVPQAAEPPKPAVAPALKRPTKRPAPRADQPKAKKAAVEP